MWWEMSPIPRPLESGFRHNKGGVRLYIEGGFVGHVITGALAGLLQGGEGEISRKLGHHAYPPSGAAGQWESEATKRDCGRFRGSGNCLCALLVETNTPALSRCWRHQGTIIERSIW